MNKVYKISLIFCIMLVSMFRVVQVQADTIVGCMDPNSLTYDPLATVHDSTACVYPEDSNSTVVGCMDPNSLTYDSLATVHDSTACVYPEDTVYGCMDSTSLTYNPLATVHVQDSCKYPEEEVYGCMDSTSLTYNPLATIHVQDSCTYPPAPVYGCMDSTSLTYNPLATVHVQDSCKYAVYGCMDPYALNYNPNATVSDTCIYRHIGDEPISGCMDTTALNYNPLATVSKPSDCIYNTAQPIYGCTDPKSLNYNPNATDYDSSCVYAEEENVYNEEIIETPIDTVGTKTQEDCRLNPNLGITFASIIGITAIDENTIIVHWKIAQGGDTVDYDVEYTITQEGNNLFYLSIVCKGSASQAQQKDNTKMTGYTVSATFNVEISSNIYQVKGTDSFVAYPNPTTGIVNIGEEATEIKVYSIQGTLLQKTFGTQVDLSSYSQGVYLLQVNGKMIKIIKL